MKLLSLKNQVALITGASRGIGRAVAERLAAEGVHLSLMARTANQLETLAEGLRQLYPDIRIQTMVVDVCDPMQCEKAVNETLQLFGDIDILINNAGIAGKIALLQEIPVDEVNRVIDTNLKAPIYMMKYVLPSMVARQQGTIININSVAGKTAFPYWSIYDASKFGLRAITEAVGEEQRMNNIKVVGIYPGAVDTPIWESIEINHEPSKSGMLDAGSIAETVVYILEQPGKVYIPEVTVAPLKPAL